MKKLIVTVLVLLILAASFACSVSKANTSPNANRNMPPAQSVNTTGQKAVTLDEALSDIRNTQKIASVVYDSDDLDPSVDDSRITYITLKGDSITLDGYGAKVNGSTVTITSSGTYSINGTLNDGQIKIFTGGKGAVRLVLNGAHINCSTSAPIYEVSSEKTVIILAEGSENSVTDGETYIFEDKTSDEPGAAIFAQDDLTITGTGSLTVNAIFSNGIQSKDDLKITGGSITVNAVNDGIKGRDSVVVKDGTVTITAKGDGVQSSNDKDADKGYVSIEGGTFNIIAGTDGIQAETALRISGGSITVSSGGGSANASNNRGGPGSASGRMGTQTNAAVADTSASAKGLKAGMAVLISGAVIKIDSSDDAVNSNKYIVINNGDITIASGDDAIHSDTALVIDGGETNITKCYEGIESSLIVINDGTVHIVASDDGININGGTEGFMMPPGNMPMGNSGGAVSNTASSETAYYLTINGGYLAVDAGGDGIDVNGPIKMTGGKVIVNGPTNNGNGPLDYTGSFVITGGYLVAAGSSGMAQAPSSSSTQYSIMVNFTAQQSADTLFHIETAAGEDIFTFAPKKIYQSLVLCSPALKKGETYVVISGGSSTGKAVDGLYSEGKYTGGTQITSLTISNMVISYGATGGGPGGGFFRAVE